MHPGVLRLPRSCYDPGAFHIMRRPPDDDAAGSRRDSLAAEVLFSHARGDRLPVEESGVVPRGV
jgi:hypothetical protein